MSDDRKWVYKSNWDFTLVIKPTTKTGVPDGQGGLAQVITVKPVKVIFNNCTLVVNEALAKRHGYPMETIVKWIEMQPTFNKHYFLAQSPSITLTKEEVGVMEEEVKKARRGLPPKVSHGAKSTASYSRN